MKQLFCILILLFVSISNISAQRVATKSSNAAAALNGKEYLLNYYQQTYDALKKSVDGLNVAQLNFKPAADKWSVNQCLEHIVLTEKMLFGFAKQGMEKAANPERRNEVKMKDEDLIKGINNRSQKATAGEDLTGKGKLNSAAEALDSLQNDRKTILEYLSKVSEEDLRNHINDSPFGPIDAYQSFLFIAGHTSRHTLQIEEVKTDKNFPK